MVENNRSVLKNSLWFFGGIVLAIVAGAVVLALTGQSPQAEATRPEQALAIKLIQPPSSGPSLSEVAPIILSGLSALVAIGAVLASIVNTDRSLKSAASNSEAERQRAANEIELKRLEGILAKFHTPYLVRAEANKNMAQDLKNRLGNPDYRMLVSLLDPRWYDELSTTDQAIVDEICATGEKLQLFIETNAGDLDEALVDHLARAVAHFRMLTLARKRRLGHDATVAQKYVYPKELDIALEEDRRRIQGRIAKLREDPAGKHGAMPVLELPEEAVLKPWIESPSKD